MFVLATHSPQYANFNITAFFDTMKEAYNFCKTLTNDAPVTFDVYDVNDEYTIVNDQTDIDSISTLYYKNNKSNFNSFRTIVHNSINEWDEYEILVFKAGKGIDLIKYADDCYNACSQCLYPIN